jgi:CubicO group peptidase (beta-lactamase class C family)
MTGIWSFARLTAAVLVAVAVAVLVGPRPLHLREQTAGDEDFAEQVRRALGGRGHHQVAAALIDQGTVEYAGFGGADEHTPFAIGSITKALDGMLLETLAADGTVRLDEPVGDLVPGTELAGQKATLRELSQHRSGLPRLPGGPVSLLRSGIAGITGGDPYSGTPGEVLDQAGDAGAPGGGEPAYSNLGAAALGDALAVRAKQPYGTLLEERVLDPLQMTSTRVVTGTAELPPDRARAAAAGNGRSLDPWLSAGWAPAGVGVWSTAGDLSRLVQEILAGTAPGVAATVATADYRDGERIGLGWFTSTVGGRSITWHDGAVGGFHAYVGFDRAAGRGVVLLSASSESVTDAAEKLLTQAGTGD